MRGDVVYRIYGVHEGREKDTFFGAFRSVAEAEAKIANLQAQEMGGRNWAEQYHNRGFVIREVIVETDFEIPSLPKPRDKYAVNGIKVSPPGAWSQTLVEVFRRTGPHGSPEKICEYERSYSLLQTFEPFRQGDRELALISRAYTDPPPFITVSRWNGATQVTFAAEMKFDLGSGRPEDWERQKIANFE